MKYKPAVAIQIFVRITKEVLPSAMPRLTQLLRSSAKCHLRVGGFLGHPSENGTPMPPRSSALFLFDTHHHLTHQALYFLVLCTARLSRTPARRLCGSRDSVPIVTVFQGLGSCIPPGIQQVLSKCAPHIHSVPEQQRWGKGETGVDYLVLPHSPPLT